MIEKRPRVFAYGGGVQSNAALVLSASGILPYTHFLFANVGHDSESPKTLEYINTVARPYAEKHGLFIIELNQEAGITLKRKTVLREALESSYATFIPASVDGAPSKQFCTQKYKIKVIESFMHKWLKATKKNPKPIGIGISLDEWQRAKRSDKYESVQVPEYPFLELRYLRDDCLRVIEEAGLPIPPKSSCWFCPYRPKTDWVDLYKENRDLFNKAVELENTLQRKFPNNVVTLNSSKKTLLEIVESLSVYDEHEDANCESGYCMV
jgi:hypothetical protein